LPIKQKLPRNGEFNLLELSQSWLGLLFRRGKLRLRSEPQVKGIISKGSDNTDKSADIPE